MPSTPGKITAATIAGKIVVIIVILFAWNFLAAHHIKDGANPVSKFSKRKIFHVLTIKK
jgi:hypothetical protein